MAEFTVSVFFLTWLDGGGRQLWSLGKGTGTLIVSVSGGEHPSVSLTLGMVPILSSRPCYSPCLRG